MTRAESEFASHKVRQILKRFDNFHCRLRSRIRNNPQSTVRIAALAWLEFSSCDWCWIWLFNDKSERFEVAGTSVRNGASIQLQPPRSQAELLHSAVQWAGKTGNEVRITGGDFDSWTRELRGQTYRLTSVDWFRENQCAEIHYIPFSSSDDGPIVTTSDDASPEVRGVVALYTRSKNDRDQWTIPVELLRSTAHATGAAIYAARLLVEQAVLGKLAKLLAEHSPVITDRQAILDGKRKLQALTASICDFLCSELHLDGVSIFYRNRENTLIRCIGSTGLWDVERGVEIDSSDVETASYRPGEGRTGGCFGDGQVANSPERHGETSSPKYREFRKIPAVDQKSSEAPESCGASLLSKSLLLPLGPPADPHAKLTPRTSGVLRILQNSSSWEFETFENQRHSASSWRRFDSLAEQLFKGASYSIQRSLWPRPFRKRGPNFHQRVTQALPPNRRSGHQGLCTGCDGRTQSDLSLG